MDGVVWLAVILPWLLLVGAIWLVYVLFRQYGKNLLNLEELRTRLSVLEHGQAQAATPTPTEAQPAEPAPPAGLEVGTPAPDFVLPDLEGHERALAEFVGNPFLLTFFSTTCGFCVQMSPRIGELSDDAIPLVLISSGEPEEVRRMAEVHGWHSDVLLASDWEIGAAYQASGTPTGYLVDAEGRVASRLLVGADQLLEVATAQEASGNGHNESLTGESLRETIRGKEDEAAERARAAGLAVKDISESRLQRDGLRAGTPAPDFTLPDLHGTHRSLHGLRGKRVLLVFSDTGCGPCEAMSPDLVRLHEEHRDDNLEIVMVSRGDVEENRAKADKYGFRFPVLLQRSREVARDYAMFATPVAYLIDEQGMIAEDVAMGPEEIMQLV